MADNASDAELLAEALNLEVEEMRAAYYAGDTDVLIAAIRFCGRWKLVVPEWIVTEFHRLTNPWYEYQAKTPLDIPQLRIPKGRHLAALRKKRNTKLLVYRRVTDLHCQGRAIDQSLFDEVGKEFGLGKTRCAEHYYAAKTMLEGGLTPGVSLLTEKYKLPRNSKLSGIT